MLQRPIRIIGLDLGASCLKAALMEKRPETNDLVLRNYATYDREDASEPLDLSVSKLVRKLKTRTRLCALAIWSQDSVLRFMQKRADDPFDPQSLQNQSDPLTRDLGTYILDFADLGISPKDESLKDFLVCGTPRSTVLELIQILANARLDVGMVQLMPVAISNAFHFSQSSETLQDPFLLADIGTNQSYISGGYQGKVLLLRSVPWGAFHFQESVKAIPPDIAKIETAYDAAVEPFARELKSCLDFLQIENKTGTDAIEDAFRFVAATEAADRVIRIHLSGYLSTVPEFPAALSREIGLPTALWNPFQKLAASDRPLADYKLLKELCRLPAAAGVALQYLS